MVADILFEPVMIRTLRAAPSNLSFTPGGESNTPTPLPLSSASSLLLDDFFSYSIVQHDNLDTAAGGEDSLPNDEFMVSTDDAKDMVRDWVEVVGFEDTKNKGHEYEAEADAFLATDFNRAWSDFIGEFADVGYSTVRVYNAHQATMEDGAVMHDVEEYPKDGGCFRTGQFLRSMQRVVGRSIHEMDSDVWEQEEYAEVAVEDVLELLTEEQRSVVLAVNMPEMLPLNDLAVTIILDDSDAVDAVPLTDEGPVKTGLFHELVNDADANAPCEGGVTQPVDMLHDGPAMLVLEHSPPPPLAVVLRDDELPDPLPSNDSLPLLLPDASVENLLGWRVEGLLEDGVEDNEDTKDDVRPEDPPFANSEPTCPHMTATAPMSADSQGGPDDKHSTSEDDVVALLLSMTEQDSLLKHITPPTTPSPVQEAFPPAFNIISPSPPARHAPTPPPSPYEVPKFLASISSPTPPPPTSGYLSRGSSSSKLRYDLGNPDDTLNIDAILRQCDGYDGLLDTTENWPTEPDAPDDWENTTESLAKLEEMQARRAEVLKVREQQQEASTTQVPPREEESFAWDGQYESLFDIVGEGLNEHEDAEEEVYGTLGMHAFLAVKRSAGIDEKTSSNCPLSREPLACPLPSLWSA